MTRALTLRALIVAVLLYSLFTLVLPSPSYAWNSASDAQCIGTAQCPVGRGPGQHGPCGDPGGGTIGKFCSDPGSGVTGYCESTIPPKCKAGNAPGLGGSGNSLDQGLSQLGQVLGQLMSKLMSGSQGSGSGSPSSPSGVNTTPTCTAQPTSDMNVYQSNPTCYYYVPPVSSTLGAGTVGTVGTGPGTGTSISDQLNSLLNTNANTTASLNSTSNVGSSPDLNPLLNITNTSTSSNTNTDTNTNSNANSNANNGSSISDLLNQVTGGAVDIGHSTGDSTSSNAPTSTFGALIPANAANLLPGLRGDIQVMQNGATILAGQRDNSSNSETSGFFGANTLGGTQGTGIVASLCQSRPWASGIFSKFIPASFFDGLCSIRGYQVGSPQPVQATPQVAVTQTTAAPVTKPKTTVVATTTSSVPPRVDIWAVPAKVNLGSRTSIFWNTQGVSQCAETSPDGSFSQTSLSGGASTVPITAATTFTISCLAPDGSHVTNYVTVDLAI